MDDGFSYSSFLRPNYEAWSSLVWAVSIGGAVTVPAITRMPHEPFWAIAGLGTVLAVTRGSRAIKNKMTQKRLAGRKLEFTSHEAVVKKVERKKNRQIWLGEGFEWGVKHIQRAQEILNSDWIDTVPRDDDEKGYHWIHGLEQKETSIFVPVDLTKGHTLITGTTRSGKTVLLRLLIAQCIGRDEPVIIVDPKSDPDMLEETRIACEKYDKKFYYIHPGFPEKSARINLIRNYSRGTDIAGRIASIIPSESGADPFVAFGHMSLNNIIQGMLLVKQRPTLVDLRRQLEGGPEQLVFDATAAWADEVIPGWESDAHGYLAKANTVPKKASAMVRFYRDKVQPVKANQDLEGLHSMFEHDREHFAKMIASLIPVLTMLTSGELGPMFSPRGSDPDDDRPIIDTARVVSEGAVLYVGTSSLSDAQVGGAIGALFMGDLAAFANERYNRNSEDCPIEEEVPVNIFVDEASEAANVPMGQVLNKGGGAKLRMYIATQTVADFSSKLGSEDKAMQFLANLNNIISMRVKDEQTQEYITGNLPKTRYKYVMHTQATSTGGEEPLLSSGNQGERLMEEESELFPPQLLGSLPDLEYIAKFANGKIVKGHIPILLERGQKG